MSNNDNNSPNQHKSNHTTSSHAQSSQSDTTKSNETHFQRIQDLLAQTASNTPKRQNPYNKVSDKKNYETGQTRRVSKKSHSNSNSRQSLPTPEEIRAEQLRRRQAKLDQLEAESFQKHTENQKRLSQRPPSSTQLKTKQQTHSDTSKGTTQPSSKDAAQATSRDATQPSIKEPKVTPSAQTPPTPSVRVSKSSQVNPNHQNRTHHDLNKTVSSTPQNETQSETVLSRKTAKQKKTKQPKFISRLRSSWQNRFSTKKDTTRSHTNQSTQAVPTKQDDSDSIYSLQEIDTKEKMVFGVNVFFNVLKRFVIYIILLGILSAGLFGGIGLGYFAYLVSQTEPPSRQEMLEQITRVEQQSTLYYASGTEIANIRSDIVRNVVSLDDISSYIIDGLVATEDEYFYTHHGIVPKAILRATLQELFTSGTGTGGSTLTQQLVKQQLLNNDVTFFRKANEILLALRVENYFSKEEILQAYLNISPFGRNNSGDNIAGIASASQGIFGVSPSEVNLAQAAFLVGLPQDPYSYTPYDQYGDLRTTHQAGIDRMKEVLFRMYRTQKITKEEYENALSYDIEQDFLPTQYKSQERQTYLYQAMMNGAIEQLMRINIADKGLQWNQVNADPEWYNEFYYEAEEQLRTGGYHVYTTINQSIYDQLQQSAIENSQNLGVSYDGVYTNPDTGEETYYVESVQSGVVVIDNTTGAVLGFVSGVDYDSNQIDHAFSMRRSPGSTIKPLAVYAPAIEHNMINPSTVIPDTAYSVTFEDGSTWTPTNYGGVVSGTYMTARNALLRSDNLPAVRIYEQLLNNNIPISDYLTKMGFDRTDSYTPEETQNLAFSLGGVTTGPTVFEQTRAFSTFANNGQYVDGYFIERIEDAFGNIIYQHDSQPIRVFSEDTNYLMVSMLRDTNTLGTGRTAASYLSMGGDWIAKSGISENSRDVWYIASTPSITIGTWIGYDNRYTDYYIDINDGYGRESERIQIYWAQLANDLYAQFPEIFGVDRTFAQPDSVQQTAIVETTGTLPGTITVNNTSVSITQPLVNEIFKLSNPAPSLTYDFLFGATDEEKQAFWSILVQRAQEELNRQRSSNSSSNNNENENEAANADTTETTTQPNP